MDAICKYGQQHFPSRNLLNKRVLSASDDLAVMLQGALCGLDAAYPRWVHVFLGSSAGSSDRDLAVSPLLPSQVRLRSDLH